MASAANNAAGAHTPCAAVKITTTRHPVAAAAENLASAMQSSLRRRQTHTVASYGKRLA